MHGNDGAYQFEEIPACMLMVPVVHARMVSSICFPGWKLAMDLGRFPRPLNFLLVRPILRNCSWWAMEVCSAADVLGLLVTHLCVQWWAYASQKRVPWYDKNRVNPSGEFLHRFPIMLY